MAIASPRGGRRPARPGHRRGCLPPSTPLRGGQQPGPLEVRDGVSRASQMRTTPTAAAATAARSRRPAGQGRRERQRAEELDRDRHAEGQPGERGIERTFITPRASPNAKTVSQAVGAAAASRGRATPRRWPREQQAQCHRAAGADWATRVAARAPPNCTETIPARTRSSGWAGVRVATMVGDSSEASARRLRSLPHPFAKRMRCWLLREPQVSQMLRTSDPTRSFHLDRSHIAELSHAQVQALA